MCDRALAPNAKPQITVEITAPVYLTHGLEGNEAAFVMMNEVESELQAMLLASVDPIYLNGYPLEEEDKIFGISSARTNAILAWLLDTYGGLDDTERVANMMDLKTVANADLPIENMWTTIENICTIARTAGEPISDGTKITLVHDSLDKDGRFTRMTETWDNKGTAITTGADVWQQTNMD